MWFLTNLIRKAVSFEFSLVGDDSEAKRMYEMLRDSSTVGDNFDFLGSL